MLKYPVYVISLKKDEERRNALKVQFESYDEFKIIDAVYGKDLSAGEYYEQITKTLQEYKFLMTPAEIGCSLSHMRAYEEFLASGAEFALVLEDDVIGNDDDIASAFNLCDNMDKNSVAILASQKDKLTFKKAFGKKLENNFIEISKYSLHLIYGTVAYVITKECASRILNIQKRVLCSADAWALLLFESGIKMYFSHIFSYEEVTAEQSLIEQERSFKYQNRKLNFSLVLKHKKSLKWKILKLFDKFFRSKNIEKLLK